MQSFYNQRIVRLGKYNYDMNKVRTCKCSDVKEIREIENNDSNKVMYFSGQVMYWNVDKKQFECFFCGDIWRLIK